MNAIELQMIGIFQHEAEPVAKKFGISLDIDWQNGSINFITQKEISEIALQKFLTEMTAIIQKHPIFKQFREV